jgi:hypothetical protein
MAGRPARALLKREATLSAQSASADAAGQAEALRTAIGERADRIAASLNAE